MGGCIAASDVPRSGISVSSLYGRVYRLSEEIVRRIMTFPPYMGGCIGCIGASPVNISVSSLYGRVYRFASPFISPLLRFLPVWEGVSAPIEPPITASKFPPCRRGCIAFIQRVRKAKNVSSLYGRV